MANHLLRGRDKHLPLSQPQVMGILNITPDSFVNLGRHSTIHSAIPYAIAMVEAGANIIDVGGEATNSHLQNPQISLQEELDRVLPLVTALVKEIGVPISVDTSKPEVMQAVVGEGAFMINDVRALRLEGALETAASLKVPVCLMHMKYPYGKLDNTQEPVSEPEYTVREVKSFLQERVDACLAAGILSDNIILDPGFGGGHFGKTPADNLALLKSLETFHDLGFPLLVGASRKTFLEKFYDNPEEERFYSSLSATLIAAMKGASIVRVHHVKETVSALRVVTSMLTMGDKNP